MEIQHQMDSEESTGFIKYSCPSCGATLELDPFNPVVKCQYCGCNFLKTDEVSKKILLDALEIKKLEEKLASAISTNSWDIQYQCYKALAMGTDNALYKKFYSFWEVLLGHNDITNEFVGQFSIDELQGFIDLMDKLPSNCIILGSPLAVLAVNSVFKHIIATCKSTDYSVSDVLATDYSTRKIGIKSKSKKKVPVMPICIGIATLLSLFPFFINGMTKSTLIMIAIIFGASLLIALCIDFIDDKFDENSIISYKVRFPNGILSAGMSGGMSTYAAFNNQMAQTQVEDTMLHVYQDGLDITYKRTTVVNNKQTTKKENIFIPYMNLATVRPMGINALSVKQRYTNSAYAFEIEEVSNTDVQSLVAYIYARMRHYQVGSV